MAGIMDLLLQQPSNQDRFQQILPLLQQQGALSQLTRGGGAGSLNYGGDTPPGRGIFFNNEVDPLQPGDPRLVQVGGVTLARPAARSLRDIIQDLNLQGTDFGGGYRSPQEQAALVASKPGLAAPVGSSYHQEGLAIDLAAALQNARVERALAQAGWNQFSPSGEPWHWSYGVTG